jgi:hypothetical protein
MSNNNEDYDDTDDSDIPDLSEIESDTDVEQDEDDSNNESDDENISDNIHNDDNKIRVSIEPQSINTTYISYLQNKSLLLRPEFQRETCWKIDKMNTFIDTIMNNYIVPSFVIYKLSEVELNDSDHSYECIDGQNRLNTIQLYKESFPIVGKYIYWNNNGERVYYNMNIKELERLKRRHPKSRNLTRIEKIAFDTFKLCFHIIETVNPKTKLSLEVKCDIFNRLQNGEKVISWVKLRNLNNIITLTICKNKLLDKMRDIDFINLLSLKNSHKEPEIFNIYFLIRTFLIIDKKNLEINYLDLNIKKSIQANNCKGTPMVQINGNIDDIVTQVIEIVEFMSKNIGVSPILPELAYIYVCIYANYGLNKLKKIIKYFKNNNEIFDKYNKIKTYKKTIDSVTSSEKIIKCYTEICNIKTNITSNTTSNTITT